MQNPPTPSYTFRQEIAPHTKWMHARLYPKAVEMMQHIQ